MQVSLYDLNVYCMSCGEDLPIKAIYCPKCGKKLETSPIERVSPITNASQEVAEVELEPQITHEAKLDGIQMSETEEITASNPTKKYILILALILIAISSVILWGLTSNSSEPTIAIPDTSAIAIPDNSDLVGRLNFLMGGTWEIDPVLPVNKPDGYLQSIILTKSNDNYYCKVFVFDSKSSAKKAFDENTLDNLGTKSYASDIGTSQGIILTSDKAASRCFSTAAIAFNYDLDPSLTIDSTLPTDNTSDATESEGTFSESKLRKALLANCTNLPSRFGTMRFQEGTVIYDAYGMPWGTYALGATHFAVRDDSNKWHVSGMDQTSNDDLTSWECETTFDIAK